MPAEGESVVFAEHLSLGEQIAVTIIPIVSGVLSIGGSSCIIWMICADWKRNIKSVKYRILLGLCISDIINSIAFCLWAFPFPKDTPGVWGAMGNEATCNASAFVIQLGGMGAFYNAGLSHYYLMVLTYGWSDKKVAKHHEGWIHAASILFPMGTATAALLQNLYGPTALGCWIAPQPCLCHLNDNVECEKAELAVLWGWVYQGIPLVLLLTYIAYAMFMVYQKVREVRLKAEKWTIRSQELSRQNSVLSRLGETAGGKSTDMSKDNTNPQQEKSMKASRERRQAKKNSEKTRDVAVQAILYVVAYLVTHGWAFIVWHMDLYVDKGVPGFLLIIENASWPLQGFLNLFVFIRPQVQAIRQQHTSLSYWQAVYVVLLGDEKVRKAAISRRSSFNASSGRHASSDQLRSNDPCSGTYQEESHPRDDEISIDENEEQNEASGDSDRVSNTTTSYTKRWSNQGAWRAQLREGLEESND